MVKINEKYQLRTFKDLIAWQKSYELCRNVYLVSKEFPRSELFGLTSQMKRSALSIPSNIAEGYTRPSTNDYLRFLYIAYSSLAELETQLILATDLNYLPKDKSSEIKQSQMEVQRILLGLIKSLKSKIP